MLCADPFVDLLVPTTSSQTELIPTKPAGIITAWWHAAHSCANCHASYACGAGRLVCCSLMLSPTASLHTTCACSRLSSASPEPHERMPAFSKAAEPERRRSQPDDGLPDPGGTWGLSCLHVTSERALINRCCRCSLPKAMRLPLSRKYLHLLCGACYYNPCKSWSGQPCFPATCETSLAVVCRCYQKTLSCFNGVSICCIMLAVLLQDASSCFAWLVWDILLASCVAGLRVR